MPLLEVKYAYTNNDYFLLDCSTGIYQFVMKIDGNKACFIYT